MRFFRKQKVVIEKHEAPVGIPFNMDAPSLIHSNKIKTFEREKMKSIRTPLQSFHFSTSSSEGWIRAEYDLAEPDRLLDTEAIFRQAVKKKTALAFKHGYKFTSSNKQNLRYIRARLAQIAHVTKTPTALLNRKIVRDLITSHNAFVIKVRNKKASGGKVRRNGDGKKLEPVAGYFLAHPSTMELKVKDRKIVKWRHKLPSGKFREFQPEDVIHFTLDKKQGFYFGTPGCVPVMDDIRALRKLEENIEIMLYQYLFPLFHYKVGTEDAPATTNASGEDEIEVVRNDLREMPSEGGIVTSHRHEIKLLGFEGKLVPAEKYLEHWLQRVLSGLGVSSIDLGIADTGNRNTADSLSRSLVDSVKDVQLVVKEIFETEIVQELLLESTFFNPNDLFRDEELVSLNWEEIDTDYLVKIQNHHLDVFLKEGLTYTELRAELGRDPIRTEDGDPEFEELHFSLFEKPLALIKVADEAYLGTMVGRAKGTGVDENETKALRQEAFNRQKQLQASKSPQTGARRTAGSPKKTNVAAKVKPSNQHGSGVPTRKKDSIELVDSAQAQLSAPAISQNFLRGQYKTLRADVCSFVATLDPKNVRDADLDYLNAILVAAKPSLVNKLKAKSYRAFKDAKGKHGVGKTIPLHMAQYLDSRIDKYVDRLIEKLKVKVKQGLIDKSVQDGKISPVLAVKSNFDALEFRTDFLCYVETGKAASAGHMAGWLEKNNFHPEPVIFKGAKKELRFKESRRRFPLITFEANEGACETCLAHEESTIYTDVNSVYFRPEKLGPFHPGCECKTIFDIYEAGDYDVEDGVKTDSCVKKVKAQLSQDNPKWSEKKIENAAWAICKKTTGGK